MDTTMQPRRRNHRGTWFVVILGLLEIGAIVAFFELKGVAGAVCGAATGPAAAGPAAAGPAAAGPSAASGGTANGATTGGTTAGGVAGGGHLSIGTGPEEPIAMPSADAGGSAQPVVVSSAAPATAGSAAASTNTSAGGDASVSGDTNQIVDPNCAGKTAAGLLNSNTPAPGPTTTCGAMKQPEALKAAERQISH